LERAAPLLDAAIKRELTRFTEGEQEAFLRDFLAEREHRVRAATHLCDNDPILKGSLTNWFSLAGRRSKVLRPAGGTSPRTLPNLATCYVVLPLRA
jgi:hypothetical protein